MKKLIQICSLLGLLVVFTAVGANAQSTYGTEVNIPFAFNVADKSYDAGSYIVKVSKQPFGTTILSIQDTDTNDVQQILLNVSGEAAGTEMKLMFANIGDRKFLSKIQTPTASYSTIPSKSEKEARRAQAGTPAAIMGGEANLF